MVQCRGQLSGQEDCGEGDDKVLNWVNTVNYAIDIVWTTGCLAIKIHKGGSSDGTDVLTINNVDMEADPDNERNTGRKKREGENPPGGGGGGGGESGGEDTQDVAQVEDDALGGKHVHLLVRVI